MAENNFINTLEVVKSLYLLGEKLYNSIKEKFTPQTDVIISSKHIGDTIFLCAFIKAYKEQHNCNKVLMIVPESHQGFISMFPSIDMYLGFDSIDMEAIQDYIAIEGLWNADHIIYGHAPARLILNRDCVEFHEEYKSKSMLVNTFDYLQLAEGSEPERMICRYLGYSEEKDTQYGNGVLLMPGAYTYKTGQIPVAFWGKVAKKLSDSGFDVFTNYNNKDCEIMIEGTQPLATSLDELVDLSRYLKGFVGIRSGICDLVAETNSKLVCIYPQMTPETGMVVAPETLFKANLYYLGREEGIWNYQYGPDVEEELLDIIVSKLSVE